MARNMQKLNISKNLKTTKGGMFKVVYSGKVLFKTSYLEWASSFIKAWNEQVDERNAATSAS